MCCVCCKLLLVWCAQEKVVAGVASNSAILEDQLQRERLHWHSKVCSCVYVTVPMYSEIVYLHMWYIYIYAVAVYANIL